MLVIIAPHLYVLSAANAKRLEAFVRAGGVPVTDVRTAVKDETGLIPMETPPCALRAVLGIEMIAAYSPEARGRSERTFGTHQERLPKELALHGIQTMEAANRYLVKEYLPAFNAEFMQPAAEAGTAFIKWIGANLDDILCEQHERTVTADNCVSFEGKTLQIPADRHRCHYVKHGNPPGS